MLDPQIWVKLSVKYSSPQSCFYTKKIDEIIKQKINPSVLAYEDIEYLVEDEENLKRFYKKQEFKSKMATFKQYYFYHQDSPRLFLHSLEIVYAKWQDRKRNLVYRKLKCLFDDTSHSKQNTTFEKQVTVPSHQNLLFEISDYNPFSKKYYIKVQERKKRDQEKQAFEKGKVKSREEISLLRHDISFMLGNIQNISKISTLDSHRTQHNSKPYRLKLNTHLNSQQNSSTKQDSSQKWNFKRMKSSSKISVDLKKPIVPTQIPAQIPKTIETKERISLQKLKSKSTFSNSGFRTLISKQEQIEKQKQTLLKNLNSKKLSKIQPLIKIQRNSSKQHFKTVKSLQKPKLEFRKSETKSKINFRHHTNINLATKDDELKILKNKKDQFKNLKIDLLKGNKIKHGSITGNKIENREERRGSFKNLFKVKESQKKQRRNNLRL